MIQQNKTLRPLKFPVYFSATNREVFWKLLWTAGKVYSLRDLQVLESLS